MYGGNQLFYAALGGCLAVFLWASASLGQEPQEVVPTTLESQPITEGGQTTSEQRAADQGQKNERTSEKLSPSLDKIEAAIRDLITQERAAQGQGPKDEEIRDLEAQEGMALWAKAMFWATIAAVILTLMGIILIRYTLKYTKIAASHTEEMLTEARETTKAARDAVDEAKAATKAAEDSVEVTRDIGMAQTRAYVTIAKIQARIRDQGIDVKLLFHNTGNTPTKSLRISTAATYRIGRNIKFPKNMKRAKRFPNDIASAENVSLDHTIPIEIDKSERAKITKGICVLFVIIQIQFEDVFDRTIDETVQYWRSAGPGDALDGYSTLSRILPDDPEK